MLKLNILFKIVKQSIDVKKLYDKLYHFSPFLYVTFILIFSKKKKKNYIREKKIF